MRYINRYQQSKSISGAAVYHERGIAVYQQPSKPKEESRLDDTVASTRVRESCKSTASKTKAKALLVDLGGVSTVISKAKTSLAQLYITSAVLLYIRSHQNQSESTSGRHSCVDQGGISTTRAVYQQQLKTEAKALLVDTAVSTGAVYQPRSAKQSICGAAVNHQRGYSCILAAIKS